MCLICFMCLFYVFKTVIEYFIFYWSWWFACDLLIDVTFFWPGLKEATKFKRGAGRWIWSVGVGKFYQLQSGASRVVNPIQVCSVPYSNNLLRLRIIAEVESTWSTAVITASYHLTPCLATCSHAALFVFYYSMFRHFRSSWTDI